MSETKTDVDATPDAGEEGDALGATEIPRDADGTTAAGDSSEAEVAEESDGATGTAGDPDAERQNRGILEALLIASDDPLPVGRIVGIMKGVGGREIRRMVDDLNGDYLESGRAFTITEVAGGFQLAVHREYASWIRQLARDKAAPRLSVPALECLAVIAFRQPVTKTEVEDVRGVAVDGVLRHLLEKGLIRIAGRADGPGRPLLYGTTREFLKHFGLKTLSDLPKPREIEELLKEREDALVGDSRVGAEAGEAEPGGGDETDEARNPQAVGGSGVEGDPDRFDPGDVAPGDDTGAEGDDGAPEPLPGEGRRRLQEGE